MKYWNLNWRKKGLKLRFWLLLQICLCQRFQSIFRSHFRLPCQHWQHSWSIRDQRTFCNWNRCRSRSTFQYLAPWQRHELDQFSPIWGPKSQKCCHRGFGVHGTTFVRWTTLQIHWYVFPRFSRFLWNWGHLKPYFPPLFLASPVCSTLLGLYKKMSEPFYVTQCVSNLLKAMIERDLQIIDGIIEPLFTALFVQVCQFSAVSSENVDNFKRKNHYEVLR